jgi:adenosylhomocysteine nucleosidase
LTESSTKNDIKRDATQADIGLVCALPLELAEVLRRCSKIKTYSGGQFTFRGGFYDTIRIAMVESGTGITRARRATNALLDAHSPRWIISTGFCGALTSDMSIGQIVVGNKIVSSTGDELAVDIGMQSDLTRGLHVGRILTVDHMVRTIAEKQQLAEQTGAIAVDMETHAVASVCRERKTRFLAVRSISDDLSSDLPSEVLSLVGETGVVRMGAVVGALWKRPSSLKDMWRLREQAMIAGDKLAGFLDGVVKQLHASP